MYRKARDADPPDKSLAYGFAEGDATGYTDTLVEADTAYAYHVVAVGLHGESEPSSEVEVDTPPTDPDSTRDGAVSLGAQPRDEGRQFFEDKSLNRANGEGITYQSTHRDIRG